MRRLITITAISILMLLSLSGSLYCSSIVIIPVDTLAYQGDSEVLVKVFLSNSQSYAGAEHLMEYDSERLNLKRIEAGTRLSSQSGVGYYEYADGKVSLVYFDLDGDNLPPGNGEIYDVYFDVPWNTLDGIAEISISEVTAVTGNLEYDSVTTESGYIGIELGIGEGEEEEEETPPVKFGLQQNYPNPFNPATTIEYAVEERIGVKIEIYNVMGQRIRILIDEIQDPGNYRIQWDGRNNHGSPVASGVYFYKIYAGKYRKAKKMILLR